ncbi:MAG: hypothetical protein WD963_00830 [Candidatus Paceibacterota bacterium]
MRSILFDRLSFLSLLLVIALLPFFFLPFTNIPIETSKGSLLVVGLVLSIIFWIFARFFDGKINLPKSVCLLGGLGVVVAVLLSAIFSEVPEVSTFGTMFDIGSFWFIFAGFLLMLMSSIVFGNPVNAKIVLFGAILSSIVVLVFQIARLFFPEILSLGILAGKTENVLGSWNALGIFAGFSALMSLLVVEFFSTTRKEKLVLGVLSVLALFVVVAVNFPLIWGLLGVFSLIIFVYKVSLTSEKNQNEGEGEKHHFPAFSFIIMTLALLFFMSGQFIGGVLPNRLGLLDTEIRPSLGSTMSVTQSVLKESPILGIGPNKFGEAWAMYRPIAVNVTDFWNIAFNSGSGLLPTLTATSGMLGILAWIIFFILLVANGVKSIFSSIKNRANWETMAFFVLSLYLFVAAFFYSTGPVIFLLALAFAGVFIGLSTSGQSNGEISISFLNDHRASFFSILFFVLLIIVSAAISFKYVERLASVSYFRTALTAETVPAAEASINKTLTLHVNDLYLRTYAQVQLLKFNSLVEQGESLGEEEAKSLQTILDQAIAGANFAISYNPKNYLNFQALGAIYQTVGLFGVEDAYSRAVEAYQMAANQYPNNPGLQLAMANASFADEKNAEAKDYANAALALKPNYVDALIVLSQIVLSEGDNAGALDYAERALAILPANEDLKNYVETLKNPNSSDAAVPPKVSSPSIVEDNSTDQVQ